MKKTWLISWIGRTDLQCAESGGEDVGPIATAVSNHAPFDRIHLLTNEDFQRCSLYCEWLAQKTGCCDPDLMKIELTSPIDYASIYEKVCAELTHLRLPREDVELTFHLSPGTPAMAAIWIILAKTRFPARLIQTSREQGLQSINFFFDLANEFLPEFLKRSSDRIERLADAPLDAPEFDRIVHRSSEMKQQIELARRIAAHDVPVLVLGETGTGKELFAEAIHAASQRAKAPFIAVNCGAIPRELVNAELFGHRKGAFTGADRDRKGHFREADSGTLFLDEIGDLPLDAQVRLLRALQQHEITPLGESRPVKVNVRIIAATHRDLVADVAEGRFREDLFHRLAVGILNLPPLRGRSGDADLLIDHFITHLNADAKDKPESQSKNISPEARKLLLSHDWPGNIRELYHTLLRAVIWSNSPTIKPDDIQRSIVLIARKSESVLERHLGNGFDLQRLLDEISCHYIVKAFEISGQKKKKAAEMLGFTNYQTLGNWMDKLGLNSEESKE